MKTPSSPCLPVSRSSPSLALSRPPFAPRPHVHRLPVCKGRITLPFALRRNEVLFVDLCPPRLGSALQGTETDAARLFAQFPWAGLTLSNHAEPIFSLWHDADWHYQTNTYLKNCTA